MDSQKLRIGIVGCVLGQLEEMYQDLYNRCSSSETSLPDVILCCGDFQPLRDAHDLSSLTVPLEHRKMGSFEDFYLGKKVAPVLTIFVGGNHEPTNHLRSLYHGGWAAKNIYFLGFSGILDIVSSSGQKLTIAGASGIENFKDI